MSSYGDSALAADATALRRSAPGWDLVGVSAAGPDPDPRSAEVCEPAGTLAVKGRAAEVELFGIRGSRPSVD